MRKAVAATRGRARRKEAQQQQATAVQAPAEPPKRQLTVEEAALTSKNYRMAKELSELRVRHREECKNVTKLTMENMNLASRCREAISQVAMLKKQLALHQQREIERAASNRELRQKSNPTSPPASPSPRPKISPRNGMSDSSRIRGSNASSKTDSNSFHSSPKTPSSVSSRPGLVSSDDYEEDVHEVPKTPPRSSRFASAPMPRTPPNTEAKETDEELEALDGFEEGTGFFPRSASPKLGFSASSYNEGFPGDIQSVKKTPVRKRLAGFKEESEGSNGSFSETKIDSESGNASWSGPLSTERRGSAEKMSHSMSSVDAFHASFNTDFPDSFSPKDGQEEKKIPSDEIYNPFAPSPEKSNKPSSLRDLGRTEEKTTSESSGSPNVRDRGAALRGSFTATPSPEKSSKPSSLRDMGRMEESGTSESSSSPDGRDRGSALRGSRRASRQMADPPGADKTAGKNRTSGTAADALSSSQRGRPATADSLSSSYRGRVASVDSPGTPEKGVQPVMNNQKLSTQTTASNAGSPASRGTSLQASPPDVKTPESSKSTAVSPPKTPTSSSSAPAQREPDWKARVKRSYSYGAARSPTVPGARPGATGLPSTGHGPEPTDSTNVKPAFGSGGIRSPSTSVNSPSSVPSPSKTGLEDSGRKAPYRQSWTGPATGVSIPLAPRTPEGPVRDSLSTSPAAYSTSSYATPPSAQSAVSSTSTEPKRPEKAGYVAARQRYEKALQPRFGVALKPTGATEGPSEEFDAPSPSPSPSTRPAQPASISVESSPSNDTEKQEQAPIPSVRARVAKYVEQTDPMRRSSWHPTRNSGGGPASDDEDGDIPMHSSLSKTDHGRAQLGSNGSSKPSDYSPVARARPRPWDQASQNPRTADPTSPKSADDVVQEGRLTGRAAGLAHLRKSFEGDASF